MQIKFIIIFNLYRFLEMFFIVSVKIIICYDKAIRYLQTHRLNANARCLYDGEFPGMLLAAGSIETGWDMFLFFYFAKQPTKAQLQLFYKLSRSYIFRHYRVTFRELVFIASPSYISITIAAIGSTI